MKTEEQKDFEESFDENWRHGCEAIDFVMEAWKEQGFTRLDVVARLLSSLKVVENSKEMHCFMIAILAERLTRFHSSTNNQTEREKRWRNTNRNQKIRRRRRQARPSRSR